MKEARSKEQRRPEGGKVESIYCNVLQVDWRRASLSRCAVKPNKRKSGKIKKRFGGMSDRKEVEQSAEE